jgi:hypothetical protein
VRLLKGASSERDKYEDELLATGLSFPLQHRWVWAKTFGERDTWLLVVRNRGGKCLGGFAIQVDRSRALPGHHLLRVRRCGSMKTAAALDSAFAHLVQLGRQNSRMLRISVELFSAESSVRAAACASLERLGFRPASELRGYENTITLDLTPPEDVIFSQLSKSTRRNVRAIGKESLIQLRAITDAAFGNRMEEMRRATMERTGGMSAPRDWGLVIDFCNANPKLSRLVGLFRSDAAGPDSLLAYAWGWFHNDHAEYNDSASVRATDIKIPLAYGLVWDLIVWARNNGAKWFDMGGVTPGQLDDKDDPLGGISDFKRFFSKTEVQVGEEWELEPHPTRARFARVVGSLARWLKRRGKPPQKP